MRSVCLALLLLVAGAAVGQPGDCLGCHIDEEGGAVHALMQTAHGKLPQACEACHGPSLEHRALPTSVSPDISYGPRWTATTAEQDGSCISCHGANIARHWNEALHMANNITCANCHDSHDPAQDLSVASQQLETCTVCHKNQATGIHGKAKMVRMNPPCTQCHNPHADQRPVGVMLANDSQGCRRCHNLSAMEKSDKVSARAKGFHRAMSTGERTCIDCHQGVAHGDTDSVEAFLPLPSQERDITLFFPGQSDADWLLTQHPGSQPLRQGTDCKQCHRGEEAAMGQALGGSSRPVSVSFESDSGAIIASIRWQGAEDDASISIMWGFGDYAPLRRGGCWAACHGDMSGMTLDRGNGRGKYLWSALEQRRQIGQPAIYKTSDDLAASMQAGEFAELWRVDLQSGTARTGTLLEAIRWQEGSAISAEVSFSDSTWSVTVRRPIAPESPLQTISEGKRYTFGVALHDATHKGERHWVSLPMTLSKDRDDTDFITR